MASSKPRRCGIHKGCSSPLCLRGASAESTIIALNRILLINVNLAWSTRFSAPYVDVSACPLRSKGSLWALLLLFLLFGLALVARAFVGRVNEDYIFSLWNLIGRLLAIGVLLSVGVLLVLEIGIRIGVEDAHGSTSGLSGPLV